MAKRKLLLADDSITIQKVVNLTFADEGIEVVAVGNGTQAVERLEEVRPDLVLADVHMPGLNGYEVCEQIRSTSGFENIPVMLLVGSFEPFDEGEAQRVGANDYLTKPFQSIKQLIGKVTSLLDSSNAEVETSFANTMELETPADSNDRADQDALTVVDNAELFQLSEAQTETREFEFGDAGFADDEMIETSMVNDFNQTADFSFPNELSKSSERENDSSFVDFEDNRETAPLSFSDIKGFNESEVTGEEIETTTSDGWAVINDNDQEQSGLEQSTTNADYAVNPQPENNTEYDFEVVEANEVFPTSNSAEETNNATYDFIDTSDSQQQTASFTEFQEAEESFVKMQTEYQAEAENEADSSDNLMLDLDEEQPFSFRINEDDEFLLDIEDDQPELAQSFQDTGAAAETSMPEVMAPENQQSQALQAQSPQSTNLERTSGSMDLSTLQFTPEVIDAIAQRVVEKLSDKVIEKIAWEIVPERFDLIVRKQMQERERER